MGEIPGDEKIRKSDKDRLPKCDFEGAPLETARATNKTAFDNAMAAINNIDENAYKSRLATNIHLKGLGAYTVPDPVPGNGALREWREKRKFTTEDRDPVSLPQRNVQILWQI
ncbi:hypothetical protein WN943_000862 [Citrus x changshan-huyou]